MCILGMRVFWHAVPADGVIYPGAVQYCTLVEARIYSNPLASYAHSVTYFVFSMSVRVGAPIVRVPHPDGWAGWGQVGQTPGQTGFRTFSTASGPGPPITHAGTVVCTYLSLTLRCTWHQQLPLNLVTLTLQLRRQIWSRKAGCTM